MSRTRTVLTALAVAAALAAPTLSTSSATAAPRPVTEVAPAQSWANQGNPYVFALGDSVMDACVAKDRAGGGLGLGYRDLGHITWPGVTTKEIKDRLQGIGTWPASTMSEESNAMEQVWFRDAGALVIGLGTNDVKFMTVDQYAANVEWFVAKAAGRPLIWLTPHNPPYRTQTNKFGARLRQISITHPNMKILELDAFFDANPYLVRGDQVHPADYDTCILYQRLVGSAVAGEVGKDAPHGYWYGASQDAAGIVISGWAAAWSNPRKDTVRVNVKINYQHFTNLPVVEPDAGLDQWADAQSGRRWTIRLPASAAGSVVCVDIQDPKQQWAPLGCRAV